MLETEKLEEGDLVVILDAVDCVLVNLTFGPNMFCCRSLSSKNRKTTGYSGRYIII